MGLEIGGSRGAFAAGRGGVAVGALPGCNPVLSTAANVAGPAPLASAILTNAFEMLWVSALLFFSSSSFLLSYFCFSFAICSTKLFFQSSLAFFASSLAF
jgi:hypothetical protein